MNRHQQNINWGNNMVEKEKPNIYNTAWDKLPDEEIVEGYKSHYDMINVTCCYGVKDCMRFYKLEEELVKRGYDVEEHCEVYKVDDEDE